MKFFNLRDLFDNDKDNIIIVTVKLGSDPSLEIQEIVYEDVPIGEKKYFTIAFGDISTENALQIIRNSV
jgi:hypothetical protein